MKSILVIIVAALFIVFESNEISSIPCKDAAHRIQIDVLAERYLELGRFSGTILVGRNDKIFLHENYGYANHIEKDSLTEETSFKIGLLSKLYIQEILRDLIQEKGIDETSFVSEYLKDCPDELRLQDLIGEQPIESAWNSYLSMDLLGQLTDKSPDELLADLSTKLKLKNSYYSQTEKSQASGHLYINQGNGLEWTLSPEISFDSLTIRDGIKSGARDLFEVIKSKAVDSLRYDGYLEQDGFSYAVDKKDGLTIIILSNNRHPIGKEMSQTIKDILTNDSYELQLPLKREEVTINSRLLKKYAGEYKMGPSMTLKVIESKDSLFTFIGPQKIHLIPQSNDQFFLKETDAAIKFVSGDDGRIKGAVMYDGFLEGRFIERVND